MALKSSDLLIRSDLREFLTNRYAADNITASEIDSIIRQLDALNAADLYDSNKTICKWVPDDFLLKREDRNQKDLYIQLIDYAESPFDPQELRGEDSDAYETQLSPSERRPNSTTSLAAEELANYSVGPNDQNIYEIVNQLEIEGREKRIPDAILYINGLPLVVLKFKSSIQTTISTAVRWIS